MRRLLYVSVPVLLLLAGASGRAERSGGEPQQPAGGVIQSQEINTTGIVAEFIECKRKEGVLSVKVRLRNTTNASIKLGVITAWSDYDVYYVTAGSKKYFVLRDEEKVPLAPTPDSFGHLYVDIPRGGAYTWWAKYPAPPDSETKINYFMPLGAPFEDIPIGS